MVYATKNNNTPFLIIRGIIIAMETTEEKKTKKTRHGQIAADKTRIDIVIPRDLKAALETAAAAENRSMSNYIVTILSEAMKQQPQDKSK